jgi:hypothetical protein
MCATRILKATKVAQRGLKRIEEIEKDWLIYVFP